MYLVFVRGSQATCPFMAASTWIPSTYTAFRALLVARICAAIWSNISDCDEVFNYWEPTHFLIYKSGFQTWEYSPVYAIRSYAYILIHALPGRIYSQLFQPNKILVFYFIRCLLAFSCTACEAYFYRGVYKRFGGGVARLMLVFLMFSSGMFIACSAYLPSAFSMYFTMLAFGAWFSNNLAIAVISIGVSAFLGWPFAGVLGITIAYDTLINKKNWFSFIKWGFLTLLILIPIIQIDTYFFGKFVIAPLNIVLYNVFTPHGPELYGVEPWTFYLVNGFLNFNIAFIAALLVGPALVAHMGYQKWLKRGYSLPFYKEWLAVWPMYIWFLIFFTQRHKEERFLFPVYPLICLAASIFVDQIEKLLGYLIFKKKQAKADYIGLLITVPFILFGISRSLALYKGYHAPFETYMEVSNLGFELQHKHSVNICVGKEWYRFPSSFFLPENWQLQFIHSEFHGQLPKMYAKHPNATSLIPEHMNDQNLEEPSRYVAVEECHYLIDLDVASTNAMEPRYSKKVTEWSVISSTPFLIASESTSSIFRAFYIPWLTEQKCSYANYILLRSKTKKVKS
ncbi:mannosyltransferase [Chamberlinius hualienensis]